MGDALVMVHTQRSGLSGRPVDQAQIDSLTSEIDSLKKRARSLQNASDIEFAGMPSRIAALQGELTSSYEQLHSTKNRLALAEDALSRLGPVASRGFISGESMRRHKEEVLVLQQAISEAQGNQARLKGQLSELLNLERRQPMIAAQQRGQLLDQIALTQRSLDSARGEQGFAIVAPVSGLVNTIQVGSGQNIDTRTALMTISTGAQPLLAELFVPSRSVGFLELGQRVNIRYDAYPYERFGFGHGTIKAISSSVLRPDQVQANVRIDEPVFRVIVAVNERTITAYGRRFKIKPGLSLTADVILGEYSFSQWLIEPLISAKGRL